MTIAERFRGYLPVVVDLETGGFNADEHALLEIAWAVVGYDGDELKVVDRGDLAVAPHPDMRVEAAALAVTGINLEDPNRGALEEREAMLTFFRAIRSAVKAHHCSRAILVAHNAAFDHGFLRAAIARSEVKRDPFHPFTSIDTASLAALALGHTVLETSCRRAGLDFDKTQAHTAAYDTDRTAELFCYIANRWSSTFGPPPGDPEAAEQAQQ